MLAKYNLNVGSKASTTKTLNIQDAAEEYTTFGGTDTGGKLNFTVYGYDISKYFELYKNYLTTTMSMNKATTVSRPNAELLKCNSETGCPNEPKWVYDVSYWVSLYPSDCMGNVGWLNDPVITKDGTIKCLTLKTEDESTVRPMVTMLKYTSV